MTDIQYISDAKGNPVGVIVPIDVPQAVTTEIATIKTQADQHLELADKFQTTLLSADKKRERLI